MKGWSWENWSCRNVQATTKKKLLWNERVKFGKLELQKCADNQQKEVLWNERLKFGKHWSCSQFKLEPQPPEHCSPDSLNCMILAHHQSPHHPHLQASYQLCFQACCQNPVHPSSMVAVLSKWKWTIAWQPSKDLMKHFFPSCQPVPKTQVESCVQCWNDHKNHRPNSGALQGPKLCAI